ncbi:MAG: HVO_2922 family protein [Halobellus sp.]
MSARFELFEDRSGQYRWRLVHSNGNIIADSGEGYATKQKAKQGIESVKQNAADAEVVEED